MELSPATVLFSAIATLQLAARNQPGTRVVYHPHKLPNNLVIMLIGPAQELCIPISAVEGGLYLYLRFPGLGFRLAPLADERRLIPSLTPRFADVGAH